MLYRTGRSERRRLGMVAVLVALSLVMLLGVIALTADGGMVLAERRQAQAAADAAALAGATDLFQNWQANDGYDKHGSAKNAARAVAAAMGYSNDGTTSTVTVNVPDDKYAGGPNAGSTVPRGYAEVIIEYNNPRIFSNILGSGFLPVRARSVARAAWLYAPPIVVLDRTASRALFLGSGNGTVYVPNGPVYVNSSSATAMEDTSAAQMLAPEYKVVGNYVGDFYYHSNPDYPSDNYMHTGVHPIADPLRYIPEPTPGTSNGSVVFSTGTRNLGPGTYDGIDVTGDGSLILRPGVYYINGGGFRFNSSGRLNAPHVMIFNGGNPPGQVYLSGTGSIKLSPLPVTGQRADIYQGLTIFQTRDAATQPVVTINHFAGPVENKYDITGVIYAANARVAVTRRNGDTAVGSQFICRTLTLTGTGDMHVPGQFVYMRAIGGAE